MKEREYRQRAHIALLIIWLVGGGPAGCATSSGKKRAVEAAMLAAAKSGWSKYEVNTVIQVDGGWEVEVYRVPYVDGGSIVVEVSSDGEVRDIRRGF